MRGEVGVVPLDARLAALAERQHGVVSRAQLSALGLSDSGVDRRVAAGRLHPLHRGVVAVGHRRLSRQGRWTAAVLACGPGAALSHRAAAAHLGLRATSLVELTVPVWRRPRPGIRLHTSALAPDEVEGRDGIPTTTVARTIFDLAGVLRPHEVRALLEEAEYRQLSSPVGLPVLLDRHPRRPGAAVLRRLVDVQRARTRTVGEAEFLDFLEAHGLPRPLANVSRSLRGEQIEADVVFPGARLIVEIDGGSHRTARRFHGDRLRDRAHLVEGWRTVRVTQLDDALASDLRALLA